MIARQGEFRKPVLGYVVSHPIQYQAPLFRRLAASEAIDFVALFGCDFGVAPSFDPQFGRVVDFGIDLLHGYRSVFLPQRVCPPDVDRFWGLRTPGLPTVWGAGPVDVLVLHGWRTAMMWQMALGAWRRSVPYFIRAETALFQRDGRRPRGVGRWGRDVAVRALVTRAAGALTLGCANERFYERIGMARDRWHRVPYFVDNEAVRVAATSGRAERAHMRKDLGVPGEAVLITAVGKLLPRKRPLDLVRALRTVPRNVHLLWIGSGEMERAVRAEAESLGVADRVHLTGFRPSTEVWRLMGASDLFALPSENEPWGLVINEAVAAGLPALVSDQCGAAEDLVVPQRTGEIVPMGDVEAWSASIAAWELRVGEGDVGDRQEMRKRVEAHSIECAARAIEDMVCTVVRRQRRA